MNRYDELLKGNQTLTLKVMELQKEINRQESVIEKLKEINYSQDRQLEKYRHEVEYLNDKIEKNPLNEINKILSIFDLK